MFFAWYSKATDQAVNLHEITNDTEIIPREQLLKAQGHQLYEFWL